MLDVVFKDDQPFWKQLRVAAVHGVLVGFGLGVGVTVASVIAAHFGWLVKR